MANDDPILTTMRFIPQHEVVQRYGAIIPDNLTNPAIKESEGYKTYHNLATRKVKPKPNYVRRSSRTKTDEAPKPSSGERVKATAKVEKSGKKKQPALGLETLSDIALTEQISWKSSEEEDDDEDSDDEIHDANVEGDKMNEEETYAEDEANVLYGDVNINLEGRGTMMTDASLPNVQATQETEDTHVILTAPINPKDVPVTTIAEPPLMFATTLPPPPTPLITHMQQTPVPTLTIIPGSSL
ncbi:hypothetical protein Tco_0411020 [Tanacetum coccineum]